MKKALVISILSSFFLAQCFYKDYKYKESLASNFYLMESDMLPSKYVSIENQNSGLVIIDDVIELIGNDSEILIKTKDQQNKITYNLIKVGIVEYPEDVKVLSAAEFSKKKKTLKSEYSYDENNGFERYFRLK
ncbi:hypothetical protein ACFFLS_18600 [Flavobacterium procerum]|uniref:Lipoprotein n=1 Tax=Flavobacterium procerum TaxID=1455569 RepID=A0ABV6BYD5_9FLAO